MFKPMFAMVAAATLLTVSFDSNALVTETGSNPICDGAAASNGVIWPPDHTMVPETVVGVTDPNGLAISIMVTGIEQSEPVLMDGSGNTQPDGSGVGTSTAYVRAERSGTGAGRIYMISFTATNSQGGQCSSSVETYVPHDQGQGFAPPDSTQFYDSTVVTTN